MRPPLRGWAASFRGLPPEAGVAVKGSVDNYQHALYVVNARKRHPKPEVEEALVFAELNGWKSATPRLAINGATCGARRQAGKAAARRSGQHRRAQATMQSGSRHGSATARTREIAMTETYEFTLLVAGADVQTDEALNALAEASCDDATVGSSGGVQHLDFDREASSYLAAVLSAVDDVETAVPGVRVVRVLPDEYVTLAEIAQRTARTRESGRLLSIGERGPGEFPPPAARGAERNKLWRWAEVASWFASAL